MLEVFRKYGLALLAPVILGVLAYIYTLTGEDISGFSPRLHVEVCAGATTEMAEDVCVSAFYGAATDGCVDRENSFLFKEGFGGEVYPPRDPRLAIYRRSYSGQREIAGFSPQLCAKIYAEALMWQQATVCKRRIPVMIGEALSAQHGLVGRPACKMGRGPNGALVPMVR